MNYFDHILVNRYLLIKIYLHLLRLFGGEKCNYFNLKILRNATPFPQENFYTKNENFLN